VSDCAVISTGRSHIAVGVIVVLGLVLTGCSQNNASKFTEHEISGTTAQRVARTTAILEKTHPLPSALIEAQFLEEQTGDGNLGPSDFEAFYRIDVTPTDIPAWTSLLTPLASKAEFAAPRRAHGWWVSAGAFGALRFYEPAALTGKAHGWIGISPEQGVIYIYTFTM